MAGISFIIGIIGNIISILAYSLISVDFGLTPDILVVTVNGAGAVLQFIYVTLFLIYAPKDKKIKTAKLVAILNVTFLGVVIAITLLAMHGSLRTTFVGILCAALTIGMYASPLSIMRTVIKTKSVEYMPFLLSFFLFLNGGVWSAYAVLVKDFYIGVPNAVGFILGSAQLILYIIYMNKPKATIDEKDSVHVQQVKEGIEMPAKGDSDDDDEELGNLKDRSITEGKTKSLPKPSVDRQHSLQKLKKTLSSGAYELLQHSSWANDAPLRPEDDGIDNILNTKINVGPHAIIIATLAQKSSD
ncbi:unnamed protein product [Dovyalis caffra]|uniref:Bidirectional sugar transporter SWEET n=1 Tax=Dovyalis caffra TaxID=77055 RepID=A0AAV1RVA7_9ROSI|nr:unnamed protein product [Dovyalis caffra]